MQIQMYMYVLWVLGFVSPSRKLNKCFNEYLQTIAGYFRVIYSLQSWSEWGFVSALSFLNAPKNFIVIKKNLCLSQEHNTMSPARARTPGPLNPETCALTVGLQRLWLPNQGLSETNTPFPNTPNNQT